MITALLRALLAVFLGWLAIASAEAMAMPSGPTMVCTYDHYARSHPGETGSERGPPATYEHTTNCNAVDHRSRGASARPTTAATPSITTYDHTAALVPVAPTTGTTTRAGRGQSAALRALASSNIAANTARVDIGGARFAQTSFSERFSSGGLFAGQTIDDVAAALRSGAMSPKDVPINVVVRDGNTLITNTRSAQDLIRAEVPRDAWNVIDRTGNSLYEELLTGQLTRTGLTSAGTDL